VTTRYAHVAPDFISTAASVLDAHEADTMVTFWSCSRRGEGRALKKAQ